MFLSACRHLAERGGELAPHVPVGIVEPRQHGGRDRAVRIRRATARRDAPRTVRTSRDGSSSARTTVAAVDRVDAVERPERVQLVRGSRRSLARAASAPARRTCRARWTSSRCAVSRHQPFGCDSAATSCADVALRQRRPSVAPRRCRARRGRSARARSAVRASALDDLIAQVLGDVGRGAG